MSAPHPFPADTFAAIRAAVVAFDRGDISAALDASLAVSQGSPRPGAPEILATMVAITASLPDVPGRAGLRAILPATAYLLTGEDVLGGLAAAREILGHTTTPPVVPFPPGDKVKP